MTAHTEEHALGRLPEPEETANLHMTPDHNFFKVDSK